MASSPYRSKLIRFAIRQTHRLKAQTGQAWRWAQCTTAWSIQTVATTVNSCWQWVYRSWQQTYQMVQGRASTWLKLTAAEQPAILAEQSATLAEQSVTSGAQIPADTPIRRILAWGHEATAPLALSCVVDAQPSQILGIATDLATGRLAWVTMEAVVVLSETANGLLQKQIIWELADYGYRLRQAQRWINLNRWSYGAAGARILAWIWQAVLYFFGSRGTDCFKPGLEQLASARPVTFALGVSPRMLIWGKSAASWVKQTWMQAGSGSELTLLQAEDTLQYPPFLPEATVFLPEAAVFLPEATVVVEKNAIVLPQSPAELNNTADSAAITSPLTTQPSAPWWDISATVVGHERSWADWFLAGLDWLLARLEQWIVWAWQHLSQLLKGDGDKE